MSEAGEIAQVAVPALVELGKLGVQVFFAAMRTAGKTEAEIEEILAAQRTQAAGNVPENLEDV